MSEDKPIGKKFFKSRIFVTAFLAVVFLFALGAFMFFKAEPVGFAKSFLGSTFDLVKETFSSRNKNEEISLETNTNIGNNVVENKEISVCVFENGKKINGSEIILNEVAWMGNKEDYKNEWVELKNVSNKEIDIAGWQLLDKDGQIKVIFPENSKIGPLSFYLLERNEDSVSDIQADILYSGNLKNEDEELRLFNSNCDLMDGVAAGSKWPAGNNTSKKTMERDKNLNWYTSSIVGGSPKKENSELLEQDKNNEKNTENQIVAEINQNYLTNNGSSTIANTTTSDQNVIFESVQCSQENLSSPTHQVLINEVAWAGTASDKTSDEWIELKNTLGNSLNLNGWQLLNKLANIKIIFGGTDNISSNGYFLLERTDDNSVPIATADKIFSGAIKNSDESLRLFDNNCRLVDEVLADQGSSKNWPAGNAAPDYRTVERGSDLIWHTFYGTGSSGIFGTPKTQNSENSSGGGNSGNNNNNPPPPQCTPNWSCGNWSACTNSNQTRSCSDQNSCGINTNKPDESQSCVSDLYTLSVSKSGNGSGVVVSSIGYINCGTDCEEEYTVGEAVNLEAIPEDGSVFDHWEGACSGDGSCDITFNNNNLSVTAVFDLEAPPAPVSNILISEIMYDFPDADTDREWVEILNNGSETVDLTGWKFFEAETNHSLILVQGSFILPAGGRAVIVDNPEKFLLDNTGYTGTILDSSFFLSNTGEQIAIKNNENIIIDEVTYDSGMGGAGDGNSLQKINGAWTAAVPTPGQ